MLQIENEFGSFNRHDPEYLQFLADLYPEHGISELLFTSDGYYALDNGTLPHILATVNFQSSYNKSFTKLLEFQPDRPLMTAEFWAGLHFILHMHQYPLVNKGFGIQIAVLDTFDLWTELSTNKGFSLQNIFIWILRV